MRLAPSFAFTAATTLAMFLCAGRPVSAGYVRWTFRPTPTPEFRTTSQVPRATRRAW